MKPDRSIQAPKFDVRMDGGAPGSLGVLLALLLWLALLLS
jgi:hypothetical protein